MKTTTEHVECLALAKAGTMMLLHIDEFRHVTDEMLGANPTKALYATLKRLLPLVVKVKS